MIVSDLNYMEDVNSDEIKGGFFTVTNWGPIGVQINTEVSQEATGVIAKNDADLTFNLNFNDNVNIG